MKKNIHILIAGIIMAFTTILHLTGGHFDHVVPLLDSDLNATDKTVLLAVWHMVSVSLFLMASWIIRQGLNPLAHRKDTMLFIAWLNLLFAFIFMVISIVQLTFAPQWILFLPIGILIFYGLKNKKGIQKV